MATKFLERTQVYLSSSLSVVARPIGVSDRQPSTGRKWGPRSKTTKYQSQEIERWEAMKKNEGDETYSKHHLPRLPGLPARLFAYNSPDTIINEQSFHDYSLFFPISLVFIIQVFLLSNSLLPENFNTKSEKLKNSCELSTKEGHKWHVPLSKINYASIS
jgi:hypothetical protein